MRSLSPILFLVAVGTLLGTSAASRSAYAQATALIRSTAAERYGLKRAWYSQIEMDSSTDHVASITLHTLFKDAYTIFEVHVPEMGRFVFSQRDRDRFGRPMSIEVVKARAEAAVERVKAAGKKVTLTERKIPQVTAIIQTERGMLHVIDVESGRTMWAVRVGRSKYPTTAAAANDQYVAAANGMALYVYDRQSGRLVWKRRLSGAPSAGTALSAEMVYVPLTGGRMEGYELADHLHPAWAHTSPGNIFVQPIATSRSLAWPTDQGQLYISRANAPAVRFRLETHELVVAPPAYRYPYLYSASRDGYVYAMHELAGGTKWRFSAGEPISQSPVVIGNAVYVFPERGGMFCLDEDTGEKNWWAASAAKFIAASRNRLYVADRFGRMMILDRKTGGLIDRMATEKLTIKVANYQNDRLLMCTPSGLLQCLHESDLPRPLAHISADPKDESESALSADEEPATEPAAGDGEPADDEPAEEPPAEDGDDLFGDDDEDGLFK